MLFNRDFLYEDSSEEFYNYFDFDGKKFNCNLII